MSLADPLTNYIDKKLINYIQKKLPSNRPGLSRHESYGQSNIAPSLGLAYYLENEVSVFSDCVLKLKQEVFRNGFYWSTVDEHSTEEINYSEIEKLDKFIQKANYNGQSLKEVLSDFEFNLNVADNAYLLLIKAYDYDRSGEIALTDAREILSIDPRDIKKMVKKDGRMGGDVWLCPTHRDVQKGEPGHKCHCGAILQQAYYETTSNENKQYYLKDEVLHSSKFYPSILYGYPPALKMLDILMAYHYLEKRTKAFYERGRAPGIATFPTNNQESLRKFWDETMTRLNDDPYYIPIVGYNTDSRAAASFLQLMQDPNTDMLEVKKELRERISSRYGVSLIFQGDTSTSGGLNNEGLQITVTNRAVEDGQTIYNDKVLPWLCKEFGIYKYIMQLNPNEEQDEMAEKERLAKDIQNARGMFDMGFDVEYKDGEFVFSGQATPPEDRGSSGGGFFPEIDDGQRNSGEPVEKSFLVDSGDYLVKDFYSDALKAIAEGALYSFYDGATEQDVEAIHTIIQNAFETNDLSLDKLTEAIVNATSYDRDRAEMIARTETSAVAMRAREIGWKQMEEERGEEFLFRTSDAGDHRVSDTSKMIAQRIKEEGGAVTIDRLKEIYREVSTRPVSQGGMGPSWTGWKNFVAHPNERSTIVRVV
jgi:hypothetical protein